MSDRRNVDALLEDLQRDLGEDSDAETKKRFETMKSLFEGFKKKLRAVLGNKCREIQRKRKERVLVIDNVGTIEFYLNDFSGNNYWRLEINSYNEDLHSDKILDNAYKEIEKKLGKPRDEVRAAASWLVQYDGGEL